ncbi:hypothetical protein HLB23_39665 [Nocardia uniformis]|uniref:Uncharacterized protein n=1 Tax=Nocardia uniformis TaxID=53432 RepID=A0A849CGB4_9NOCA|nr:hypothetical protein [Nocardia uniformis]NNH75905.1 hypothetical protein [Nocardia uniformis]
MDLPARREVELAVDIEVELEYVPRWLQRADGSWSVVGPDGWPVSPEDFAELHADAMAAIAAVSMPVIDVEPISVRDTEI